VTRTVARTARFRSDAQLVVDHYAETAAPGVAERFVDALAEVVETIAQHPDAGSLRFADAADMPGLRSASVRSFPYLVFWISERDRILLVRLLHARRDLPAHLTDEPDGSDRTPRR
jgi:toxin ParE1/3/4